VVKAFHDRIIPAIPFTAHAAHNAMLFEQGLKIIAAILIATIRVMNESFARFSPPNSHKQGIHDQLTRH